MSNKSSKFLVIDTETTGLSPTKHGLIQIAALALDVKLNIKDTFVMDICPPDGYEVSEEAMKITGFTLERIEKGASYKEFCDKFSQFVKNNFDEEPTAIGQFYPFDFAVLDNVFTRCGFAETMSRDILTNKFIDTKSLVLSINLKASMAGKEIPFPVASLSKPGGLKDKFGIYDKFQAHDALGDVMATREVLINLLNFI